MKSSLLLGYAGTVTGSGIVELNAMSLQVGTQVELEDEVGFPTTRLCWHCDWKRNRRIEGCELRDSCGT